MPWVHEQERRNKHAVDFDCTRCKANNGKEIRQSMGCGYELPISHARPWQPSNLNPMHSGEFTTCPGYTTKLPEVIEIATLRLHAKMGSLSAYLGDLNATDAALTGMTLLEGATNEASNWAMQNPEKKS